MAPTQVVCDPIILCHLVQISSAFKKFGIKDASENVLVVVLHSSRDGHEVSGTNTMCHSFVWADQ